jgi:hypothetical protein
VAAVCVADEPESIYVANTKVITVRDKGACSSTIARAVAIEKAIAEVISKQDTQHPDLSLREVDGLWTVFAGDVKLAAVYPAEAEVNGLPAKSLAAIWLRNLNENLPKATPCSKLPASAFEPKPGVTPVAPPAPREKSAPIPAPPATPVAVVSSGALPTSSPAAIGAPLLLVRDAFVTIRTLPEEEYIAKCDEIAGHLISDLAPFITGRVPTTASRIAAPATPARPTERMVVPVTPPVVVPEREPEPVVEPPPVVEPSDAAPAATDLPEVKAGDASYAKVPQKNRIRQKLERAREPFLALKNEDRQAAKPIDGLLAGCRASFARGDFDQAEQYIDTALQLLGIQ